MQIGAPKCQAPNHKTNIPDFVNGAHGLGTRAQWFSQKNNWGSPISGMGPQNRYTGFFQLGSWAGHTSAVVWKNENWSFPMSGTQPQNRITGFCQWGSWAGHTSTVNLTNANWGSPMPTRDRKRDIPDFVNGEHWLGTQAQ